MAKCRSDREVLVSESFASLSALLGAAPPDSVAGLPDDVLARLADQIVAARRLQKDAVDDAVQTAVTGVPLPVRGIVRKALL